MRRALRSAAASAAILFQAPAALAFPTWMGVYGAHARHSGQNHATSPAFLSGS